MMKKLVMLVLAMVLLVMAACAAPATQSDQAAAAGGATEVTYMLWGSPDELAVWQTIVDDFHKANPDINVKVELPSVAPEGS